MLLETWVENENYGKYEKYFSGFQLKWVSAVRRSRFGRATGGILVGVRNNQSEWIASIVISYVKYLDSARVGSLRVLDEGTCNLNENLNVRRVSRDSVVNTRGKKVIQMTDDEGLVVLNGRVKGDE